MKILAIITFLFLSHFTFAQEHPEWIEVPLEETLDMEYRLRDFTYFKDMNNSLDKFVGTWVYSVGNEYFKITFFKLGNQMSHMNLRQKEDILFSRYEYKKNGVTVFATYSTNISRVSWSFMINSNLIALSYNEPSFTHCEKEKIGDLEITYSINSNNQPILNWTRTDVPINQISIPCQGSTTADTTDFLAPANMLLIKQ